MAMDFLGAMFKGIGDTFTAGSNANIAQIQARIAKLQLQDSREARLYQTDEDRLSYLLQTNAEDTRIIEIVLIAAVIIVGLVIVFK